MSNKDSIHNYPKSSCACWECDKIKYKPSTGQATNMSVAGCDFSESFDCNPRKVFKTQIEPSKPPNEKHIILNPSSRSKDKFYPYFKEISGPNSSCKGTTYWNSDPRLYNSASVSWLQLDRPPMYSTPKLNTLSTNKKLDGYGQKYRSYNDINTGQVLYYIDKDLENVYFDPLFAKPANMVGTLYKDPMGSMKPDYNRYPIEEYNPATEEVCEFDYNLSFMRDTQYQREDILALQMRKHNQQRYAPRWTNVNQ